MIKEFENVTLSQKILRFGILVYAIAACTSISGDVAGLLIGLTGCIIYMLKERKIPAFAGNARNASILILLLLATTFISTMLSVEPSASADRFRVFAGETMMFILMVTLVDDTERSYSKSVINILVMIAVLESAYGVLEFMTGIKPFSIEQGVAFSPIHRMRGTLGHWNALGGVLGMIFPLSFAVTLYYSRIKNRLWYFFGAGTFLILLCIILTFTRGAWVGTLCGITLMGIAKYRKILYLVLLGVLLIFLIPQSRQRIESTLKKPDIERFFIWESSLDMTRKKPLFGWGQDTFKNIFYSQYTSSEKAQRILDERGKHVFDVKGIHFHSHNIFITLLQETGIAGAGVFLLILIAVFARIIKVINSSHEWEKMMALGLLGVMTDFVIHGMFDFTLRSETGYMFWFLAGLLFSLSKTTESKEKYN